jgi:nitrite reductase (NAD(P)H)
MSSNLQPQVPIEESKTGPIENGGKGAENESHAGARKKVVVVGLGMVGISFM